MESSGPVTVWESRGRRSFLLRLFQRSLQKFLSSGRSPGKLALTLALGVTIGILPLLWGTTLLCAAAAALFRLNPVGIQAVNYLVYPIQLLLFVPFSRMGERFFPISLHFAIPANGSLCSYLARAGMSNIKAIGAWGVVAPFLAVILYLVSLQIFSGRMNKLPNN